MRISDWSSTCALPISRNGEFVRSVPVEYTPARTTGGKAESHGTKAEARNKFTHFFSPLWSPCRAAGARAQAGSTHLWRSEEHTSELQSLMRISYAVSCLQKQKSQPQHSSQLYNMYR